MEAGASCLHHEDMSCGNHAQRIFADVGARSELHENNSTEKSALYLVGNPGVENPIWHNFVAPNTALEKLENDIESACGSHSACRRIHRIVANLLGLDCMIDTSPVATADFLAGVAGWQLPVAYHIGFAARAGMHLRLPAYSISDDSSGRLWIADSMCSGGACGIVLEPFVEYGGQ